MGDLTVMPRTVSIISCQLQPCNATRDMLTRLSTSTDGVALKAFPASGRKSVNELIASLFSPISWTTFSSDIFSASTRVAEGRQHRGWRRRDLLPNRLPVSHFAQVVMDVIFHPERLRAESLFPGYHRAYGSVRQTTSSYAVPRYTSRLKSIGITARRRVHYQPSSCWDNVSPQCLRMWW